MTCAYTFKGKNGKEVTLKGKPAFKAFLADGGLEQFFPDRAFPWMEAQKFVKPTGKIEDFGEKLGGARKDRAPSLEKTLTSEEIASQPLSKIWPAEEIDKIENKFAAAVAYAARAEIPAKPRVGYKQNGWVSKVQALRGLAQSIMAVGEDEARQRMSAYTALRDFSSKVALLDSIDRGQWGRIGEVSEHPSAYRYVDGQKVSAAHVVVQIDGRNQIYDGAASVADVVEKVNQALGAEAQAKKMQFEVRGREGSFSINKKGDKEYRKLKNFATAKEAFEFIKSSYDDLVAAWDAVKESDNVTKADVRGDENRPRTGQDWRKGKDVEPQQFIDDLGFRGVEFGNWVGQGKGAKERQGMLNQAYDALMDLASIVGVPPKAISLNGSLGLAFGSRGSGSASAHFEPSNLVINLTKTRGAGTLAHEWFHSLDNYFSRQRGGEVPIQRGIGAQEAYRQQNYMTYRPEPMMVHKTQRSTPITKAQLQRYHEKNPSSGYYNPENWQVDPKHPTGVRPEVEAAFAELVKVLNDSPMASRSARNDKGSDGYWSRIIERGARSFENYVISKMMENGYNNDYLANVRPVQDFQRAKERYPYLLPEEVKPIAEAFDNLFGTIETKEEGGRVPMFSVAADKTTLAKIMLDISSNDDAFRYPRSTATSLEGAFRDVAPDFKVAPMPQYDDRPRSNGYIVTAPDGSHGKVYVFDDRTIQIDVSGLKSGQSAGSAIYAAVSDFAANTGRRFEGDAAGISLSGILRRMDNMLSSILKHGSSEHIAPHPEQISPDAHPSESVRNLLKSLGFNGITWRAGDNANNIAQIATESYNVVNSLIPEIQDVVVTEYGDIERASDGELLSDADIARLADRASQRLADRAKVAGAGEAPRIGSATVKRALVVNTVARQEGVQGGRELLDAIGRELRSGGSGVLRNVLYSVQDGVTQAEFGPVRTEYQNDPGAAIERLMEDESGEAIFHRPDVGDISIVYGDKGAGLAHIAERRGSDFMARLPDLLKTGKLYTKDNQKGRFFIGNERDEAVIRLDWNGKAKTWLLSAYEKYPNLTRADAAVVSRRSQVVEQRTEKTMTKDELRQAINRGATGAVIDQLVEHGTIVLHDTAKTLPKEIGKNVRGVQAVTMPDGTIHMVAANLQQDSANAVLLHEIFHRGGEKLIGSEQWAELLGRGGSLYRQSEKSSGKAREVFDRARARVAAAKAQGAVATRMEVEEFLAYSIEEYQRDPQSLPAAIRKWVEDLIGMVKAWMVKAYGKQVGQVTPSQLAAFAKLAVMDVAIARRGEMFGPIGELFSAQAVTKTPAFKRWFGSSKVVDANGEPLVVYHGTTEYFSSFKGQRSYFTDDPWYASHYATRDSLRHEAASGGNVIPAYLSIRNPLDLSKLGDGDVTAADMILALGKRGIPVEASGDQSMKQPIFAWTHMPYVRDLIVSAGYDGIVQHEAHLDGSGKATVYIAFQPEQIKSAVGNNGDFDPDNPDIRFSVAAVHDEVTAEQLQSLTPDEQGLLRRVQSAIQDNMNRLKQVQDRIKKLTGLKDLASLDYYRAEANRPGRIAARLEDAKNQLFEPLMQRLAEAKKTPEQLEELLHAMHAKERNEKIAKINDDMPDGGSGMMNAEAAAILRKYRGDKELHDIAKQARAIAKETLQLKHAYGLIDSETLDTIDKAYDYYVPLKGDGEFGPKIKRAMGHEGRDEHILDNIARDYDQAVVVGEKNLARQSLLNLVLQFKDDALWTARVPPKGRYLAGRTFYIMQNGKKVASFDSLAQATAYVEGTKGQADIVDAGGEKVVEYTKPLQDNEIMVYVNGQPVRIQINDEKLASQLRPLDQGRMNPILEAMRGLNHYLGKIYTGYNPAFMLRNMVRDSITGTINILGREGAKTAAQAWHNYPKALASIAQWAATKEVPDSEMGKYLNQYRMYGGKVGASWMSDLEQQGKTLQRMYEDAYGASGYLADGKSGKAAIVAGRKIVGGMAHAVEIGNQATENALRLALFVALREQGVPAPKAAQAAKTVTVDFDRKGSATPVLGAIYLFLNPSIQGTANAISTIATGEHKVEAWTALATLAALGLYAASAGMDDDKDRWLGQSWDYRTKSFVLNVGGHEVRVPISYEFAPAYAFGIGIGEALHGEKPMRSAHNIVSSFLDAYFPLSNAYQPDSDNHLMDAAMAAVPTAVKPGVEIAANRNTFGSQIVPESDFTKDRPDNMKMFRATKGMAYDAAAQAIAAPSVWAGLSGRYENDLTKVSPETIKYLWRTYTGGLGQFVTDSLGTSIMAATDPGAVTSSDIPFVKDFYRTNDVKPIRSRYYDLARESRAASEEFKQAQKAGDSEAVDRITKDDDKLKVISVARTVSKLNKQIAQLRDMEVEINADKNLSVSEKRDKLKQNEAQQEELYRIGISLFK